MEMGLSHVLSGAEFAAFGRARFGWVGWKEVELGGWS